MLPEVKKPLMVDFWRIKSPINELYKHVDWQIDEQVTLLTKKEASQELDEETLQAIAKRLGQYDIIWTSYHAFAGNQKHHNFMAYALLMTVQEKYGTKFIIDFDDNVFTLEPTHPIWELLDAHHVFGLQQICRTTPYISTTTEYLAKQIKARRKIQDGMFVVPNMISADYIETQPKNRTVKIGWAGGFSHFDDLHQTGVLKAMKRLMHEHPGIHFVSVGMPIQPWQLPEGRYTVKAGGLIHDWLTKIYPKLKFDIFIAPIIDNPFNRCKSDIKWQEATRMGAVFVGSKVQPYLNVKHNETGLLADNTQDDWYAQLMKAVTSVEDRRHMVTQARKDLVTLEKGWEVYKNMFEEVYNDTTDRR